MKKTYKLADFTPIVRPFWPGADYTKVEYPDNAVVVDKPPFSNSTPRRLLKYPDCVTSVALLGKVATAGLELKIDKHHIRLIPEIGKTEIFGGGFLLSDVATAGLVALNKQIVRNRIDSGQTIYVELTEVEHNILRELNNGK